MAAEREEGSGISGISVSVIVPIYNSADFLTETLDSIAAQDLDNFEVILVDDGSTDKSSDIAKNFCSRDSRFTYIRQENQGAGSARNLGMQHAGGEYFAFLDADDLFDQKLLSKLHGACSAARCDVAICKSDSFYSGTSKVLCENGPKDMLPEGMHQASRYSRRLLQLFTSVPWDKLFRADFVKQHGIEFQNLAYSNDNYFVVSALAEAETICIVPEVLVHYRVGTGSSLRDRMSKDPTCDLLALDAIYERITKSGDRASDLLKSFREWAAAAAFVNARNLVIQDEEAATLFCSEYFSYYDGRWKVNCLAYADVMSRKTLWKYRRFRNSSVRGFIWACLGGPANRVASMQKTTAQKGAFALRLILASAFTKGMACFER